MDDADQESRIVRMARRHGLRLVTSIRPAGYILVNGSKVVEFGASPGPHRPTLDEVEQYLTKRAADGVGEQRVMARKRPP
jgi:hypothetical protein